MKAEGISPSNQGTILFFLGEAKAKISSSNPEIGCTDDL